MSKVNTNRSEVRLTSTENSVVEEKVKQPFYGLTPSDFWWKEQKCVFSSSTMRFCAEYQIDAVGGIPESSPGAFLQCQASRAETTPVDAGITVFERSRS